MDTTVICEQRARIRVLGGTVPPLDGSDTEYAATLQALLDHLERRQTKVEGQGKLSDKERGRWTAQLADLVELMDGVTVSSEDVASDFLNLGKHGPDGRISEAVGILLADMRKRLNKVMAQFSALEGGEG